MARSRVVSVPLQIGQRSKDAVVRLRFTGEWPPPGVWLQYPNWEYALDEEGAPGHDETTLRPSDERQS